ncbi:MAG TPA: hypothetical protein VG347_08895 [Verrucomicrobiae bacterium]|nr:hypothetical protein [Verrucomicrobiae bacterium]
MSARKNNIARKPSFISGRATLQTIAILPPLPKSFKCELARSDEQVKMMNYVDGDKKRFEQVNKTGQLEIEIYRRDLSLIWELYPHAKTYFQSKLDLRKPVVNPDTFYDWKEEGFKMINKRKCQKFVGREPESRWPYDDAREICFVDVQTGMRRRAITFNPAGTQCLTVDWLNAEVGSQPNAVFEIPPNFKRVYRRYYDA